MEIQERIAALRALMQARNIDVYYIPNEDDHLSQEYTADHFKCKSWLTGFTGDAGCAIVTRDFAGLWTDGRYFTQAEMELAGTGVTLMRLRQEGVPNPLDFLIQNTPDNGILGFDGHVVSAQAALTLSRALSMRHASLHMREDLVGMIWKDRPAMPEKPLFLMNEKYTGENAGERLARVRKAMAEKGADVLVLTALEDPCWVLNVRGDDIPCTPVPYAFALIEQDQASYYVAEKAVSSEVAAYLTGWHVSVKPYGSLQADLSSLSNQVVWADLSGLNAELYDALRAGHNRILNAHSPVELFRAMKNETEIANIHHAHLKDGIAMVKFVKWVKDHAASGTMSELSAQNHLYALRAAQPDYLEPSFPTISAYQANGAMMHYVATEKQYAMCKPQGFLLVDSGGTYRDGSTDITRTISLGKLTAEEKKLYTLVLKGHLALARARFLYGTCGNNLDILARGPLWDEDIDYQCGTGHGVGHVLGVHEGPQAVRWGVPSAARPSSVLEDGMVVTDEPGVYLPHKVGIRIENELLVRKGTHNFYGQWLYFEDLTLCPYDRDAIDVSLLEKKEIEQINVYHQHVYDTLSPYLNEEEKQWLWKQTREL
ncbi:MAG: aminopeptidase P family protein [Lactimicrobium massiliense]|nr:aminopeptidase P family protein [Lactimicrobium massiliense]MDD6230161.1 aminopeptidase P family protein [Lactimicrobium massiliense]